MVLERRSAHIFFLSAGLATLFGLIASSHRSPSATSSDTSGAIEGQVIFDGTKIPRPTQVENTTDPAACARVQSLENVLVSTKNRGVENVILALKDVPLPRGYRPEPSRLVLDNRKCRFRPHVAVLTTGSSIKATNSDRIFHSVHLYGVREQNLGLPPHGSKVVRVARPETIIVKCDIHGWMQAFIRVDDHPFHSVSAGDGSFHIEQIPPGSYMLEAWHEHFGSQETEVTIRAGSVSRVTLFYSD